MARILGVRHHGPGSARAVARALADDPPDLILIEGPPDANEVIPLVVGAGMAPPVSLLVYPPDEPARAVMYPFAEFSPEWVALRFGVERSIPTRFFDLPISRRLPKPPPPSVKGSKPSPAASVPGESTSALSATVSSGPSGPLTSALVARRGVREASVDDENAEAVDSLDSLDSDPALVLAARLEFDPIGALAQAEGFDDGERWWEARIERRCDSTGVFEAVQEAMVALRQARDEFRAERRKAESAEVAENAPASDGDASDAVAPEDPAAEPEAADEGDDSPELEDRREAWMRQEIRDAEKAGFKNIAVICGAWHGPALVERKKSAKADRELLKGLPKRPTTATWIPWTNSRLSLASGYGAGIRAPGWYEAIWKDPTRPSVSWCARATRLLRDEDLPASADAAIQSVRLAETLAAMRGHPSPGLEELDDALLSVACSGRPEPMALIRRRLAIGDRLGMVPESAPTVPIARDLEAIRKRLRLVQSLEEKTVELDLREEGGRDRSRLLHRLGALDIPWGRVQSERNRRGSFAETWLLEWKPEYAVRLIEANVWGSTVESAAAARLVDRATRSDGIDEVTATVEVAHLAGLIETLDACATRLRDLSAVTSDVAKMMDAWLRLDGLIRYGDVRGAVPVGLASVAEVLFGRAAIGLAPAATGIDDESAANLAALVASVSGTVFVGVTLQPNVLEAEAGASSDSSDETESEADVEASNSAAGSSDEALPGATSSDKRGTAPNEPALKRALFWAEALNGLREAPGIHPRLQGLATRLLADVGRIPEGDLRLLTGRGLSGPPAEAAAWLLGLLTGGGMALVHRSGVLAAVDDWLSGLGDGPFQELLPLVRRSFADFVRPERRSIAEMIRDRPALDRTGGSGGPGANAGAAALEDDPVDPARGAMVLDILRLILGTNAP